MISKDKVLDSFDIISRIEELQEERESLKLDEDQEFENEEDKAEAEEDAEQALADWDAENGKELTELLALEKDARGCSDWDHGETLIREDYWREYIKELLEDCGDVPAALPGYIAVDWETTCANIAQDYSIISFGNTDYYIRAC